LLALAGVAGVAMPPAETRVTAAHARTAPEKARLSIMAWFPHSVKRLDGDYLVLAIATRRKIGGVRTAVDQSQKRGREQISSGL
jgi:hypothetical protein